MIVKPSHTFEEAVALTGTGRFHWLIFLTIGAALLGITSEGMSMSFVLPVAKCELAISNVEQGMINAVAFTGVVLSSHFWGFMSDTWGRLRVLRFSLLFGFLFSTLSSFSVNSTMLLVTRFLVGLTVSGVQAASISYLGEFHGARTRTKWVTLAIMCMPLACVYQPAMGLIVMPRAWQFPIFGLVYRTWRIFIMFSSSIVAVAFAATCWLPESPKFLLAMGRAEEALSVLRHVYRWNTGRSEQTFAVHGIQLEQLGSSLADAKGFCGVAALLWRQTYPIFRPPYIGNMIMLLYLSVACYVVSHGFYMWAPQILSFYLPRLDGGFTICGAVQAGIGDLVQAAKNNTLLADDGTCRTASYDPMTFYIIIAMGLFFCLMYLLVAVNQCSLKLMFTAWLLIGAGSAVAMFWADNFYANMVLMTLMMSCGNCGGILSAVAADLFPTHYKAMALCFIMMFGRIGAITGSNIVARMLEHHCDYIFVVNCSLLIVGAVVCYALLHKTEAKKKENLTTESS